MKKIKIDAPAKINLTLDITGTDGGYHQLNSLVTTIALKDVITIKKRSDNKVTIKEKGILSGCDEKQNNAYKTAVAFIDEFKTCGVDITINKSIPVGGGLGGSSADISAVLNGMKKLFGIEKSVVPLSKALGSDTTYMLEGGLKVISGRGENITPVNAKLKLYLLLITAESSVSAGACYKRFDEQGVTYPPVTENAVKELEIGNKLKFLSLLKNDLYPPAKSLVPQIAQNLLSLKSLGCAFMTGSGSVVVGAYTSKKQLNKAYKTLYPTYTNKLIKTKTI